MESIAGVAVPSAPKEMFIHSIVYIATLTSGQERLTVAGSARAWLGLCEVIVMVSSNCDYCRQTELVAVAHQYNHFVRMSAGISF